MSRQFCFHAFNYQEVYRSFLGSVCWCANDGVCVRMSVLYNVKTVFVVVV